ncbi:ty3-gypsy retrotransposon protein [Tanacetum coccineum]
MLGVGSKNKIFQNFLELVWIRRIGPPRYGISNLLDTEYRTYWVRRIELLWYDVLGSLGTAYSLFRYGELAENVLLMVFDQSIICGVSTDVDTAYSSKSGNGLEFFKVIRYGSERDALLRQLRQNLLAAMNRMEETANHKRREVEFTVGDKILERVRKVAYRLALPTDRKIHLVFHVSILKPFFRHVTREAPSLPEEVEDGRPIEQPVAIYGSRVILRNGQSVLVQWVGRSSKDATWEWLFEFQSAYPTYDLEDKVIFKERGNDTPMTVT